MMRADNFIRTLIGYGKIDVLGFETEQDKYHPSEPIFVASVELWEEAQYRCPICGQKCGKYDSANDVMRWRGLDMGKRKFYIECKHPRCLCPQHGALKSQVPWAFPNSNYTRAFDVHVAYAAAKMPTNLVSKEYRIKWGTVGNCVRRAQKSLQTEGNSAHKIKRIAIDETSYLKGYKYITTIQDLEIGEIIWAHDGYGDEVLSLFFISLTPEQRAEIEFVVADGARWITRQVEEFCPTAERCVDPFHVVGWATEALDTARKRLSDDTKKNDLPF